jgi:hypothetical protein
MQFVAVQWWWGVIGFPLENNKAEHEQLDHTNMLRLFV